MLLLLGILFMLWLFGFIGNFGGSLIHLLLLIIVIVWSVNYVRSK